MKQLLLSAFLFINTFISSQSFNEYKYIYFESNDYSSDIMNIANSTFTDKNFIVVKRNELNQVLKAENFKHGLFLRVVINYTRGVTGFTNSKLRLSIFDPSRKQIFSSVARHTTNFDEPDVLKCFQKATSSISQHKFKGDVENKDEYLQIINRKGIDLKSEVSVREYFDKIEADNIEGIWEYSSSEINSNNYRLAIFKHEYSYYAYILEGSGSWFKGQLKAKLEPAATDELLTIKWLIGDKQTWKKTVGTVKNNALITFKLIGGEVILYRVYPKITYNKIKNNSEWAGNGSGIIISKSGYIITNHHVIDDADDIEVEFILDDEVQKFNAEIVQSDKVNDIAIIKIVDINFDGVKELPYNFKTRSSDVGTKVYAFGYPMALSIMGKEIKVTDGIISSKTGFDGDITSYQITAPIQGGNSGGPLFDDKGNFIGINASKINVKIADNVGYSIKTSYVLNLIDILPKTIDLPSNTKLASLPLTEQIKEISKYVVLVKVK